MPVKVSVIVPVYNPGTYIDECIASILRQSLPAGRIVNGACPTRYLLLILAPHELFRVPRGQR